ncbi:MAG: 30S ribosomal protein S16 [Acidobacteriota bacterium]
MLRLRLTRKGAKKAPHYRIVVTERANPRDGRFVEILGHYCPVKTPAELRLNLERVDYWLSRGAQPTRTVQTLIRRAREAQQPAEGSATEPVTQEA